MWSGGARRAPDAARELPNLPLDDALQLVHLYAERESSKFERAAMRWLERCLAECSPRLQHFAGITASLADLEPERAVATLEAPSNGGRYVSTS